MISEVSLEAFWNTITGALWVQSAEGEISSLGDSVSGELSAYDALATAGYARVSNFLIVAGAPHVRSLEVHSSR